jgi:RHS repeat-associated protein
MVRTSLYAAGQHWGDYTQGTGSGGGISEYRLGDEVGTMVYNDDENGNVLEACGSWPFGEQLTCTPSVDYTETHYADKKRDQESSLDYMGARYYSSTLGRFLSPDPVGIFVADPSNPQSWNLYSYVLNNPLSFVDPDGRDCVYLSDDSSSIEEVDADSDTKPRDCSKTGGYYVPGRLVGYGTDSDSDISSLNYVPYSTAVSTTSPQPTSSPFSSLATGYTPQILTPQQVQTLVSENNLSGLSNTLVACLVQSESGGNVQAVPLDNHGQYDRSGFPSAKGLMQVNNGAADYLAGRGNSGSNVSSLLFNPAFAVEAGSAYLGVLARKTGSAYNGLSAYKGGSVNQGGIDAVAACAGISKH